MVKNYKSEVIIIFIIWYSLLNPFLILESIFSLLKRLSEVTSCRSVLQKKL